MVPKKSFLPAVKEIRDTVLELRRGKGMVLNPNDRDTWSAGSFFTNPIVPAEKADEVAQRVAAKLGDEVAETMPRFDAEGGKKLSAAWLIERAGFKRGYPGIEAQARLSTLHTLALTNRGEATSKDIVDLARTIRDGVFDEFGVKLVPEPVWLGTEI